MNKKKKEKTVIYKTLKKRERESTYLSVLLSDILQAPKLMSGTE